jgi:hypothetical protein
MVESTREIYGETVVQTSKVMHHHSGCLQNLDFTALHAYQINMLTNHIMEKQLSAYRSEAEWEASIVH